MCVCVCVCVCVVCVSGEVFNQEEMDEMISAAVDKEKGIIIIYRDFVTDMLPETAQI